MSDKTSIASLKQWCGQARKLVGGSGGDESEVADSGELMAKLKSLLEGEPPFKVSKELWEDHKRKITAGLDEGTLTEDDITAGKFKDVLKGVTELSEVFTAKREAIKESAERMEALGVSSVGKTVLFGSTDIKATLSKAEALKSDFAKQADVSMKAVEKTCTPAFGSSGPSETLLSLWAKTDEKAYKALQKQFASALQDMDFAQGESLLKQMAQLPAQFERGLSKILNFKRDRGEGLEDEELIELSDLDQDYKQVMEACRSALSEVKGGRTRSEVDNLQKRYKLGEEKYKATSARDLPALASGKENVIGSLAFFKDLEMQSSAVGAPAMSDKEKADWDSVCDDVKKTYTNFKNSNFQARGLRGPFMPAKLRSDFMKKQFKLGRSHRIDGVLFTVAPSDAGSTSLHAPIPKNLQWYNAQGKLAKSFIYHY